MTIETKQELFLTWEHCSGEKIGQFTELVWRKNNDSTYLNTFDKKKKKRCKDQLPIRFLLATSKSQRNQWAYWTHPRTFVKLLHQVLYPLCNLSSLTFLRSLFIILNDFLYFEGLWICILALIILGCNSFRFFLYLLCMYLLTWVANCCLFRE